jgi:hypothetical protein
MVHQLTSYCPVIFLARCRLPASYKYRVLIFPARREADDAVMSKGNDTLRVHLAARNLALPQQFAAKAATMAFRMALLVYLHTRPTTTTTNLSHPI